MADSGRRTVTERNHQRVAMTSARSGSLLLTHDRLMPLTVRRPLLTDHR